MLLFAMLVVVSLKR